jgi:hypothetical protein
MAASVAASLSLVGFSERQLLVLAIVGIPAVLIILQTFVFVRVRHGDAPAPRLKEAVRNAYAEAVASSPIGSGRLSHD